MKRLILLTLLGVIWLSAQNMNQYCSSPPFVGGKNAVVTPAILISQDMTGSMVFSAYHFNNEPYDSNKTYYGYADPTATYRRVYIKDTTYNWFNLKDTTTYKVLDHIYYLKKDPNDTISGNWINYKCTARIDIARKVFTGGKGRAYNDRSVLFFERGYTDFYWNQIMDCFVWKWANGSGQYDYEFWTYGGIITTDEVSKGVIREIADQDDDYMWDSDAPYFALQVFSTYSVFDRKIVCPFGSSLSAFLDSLDKPIPWGGTWVGDAIFEAIHYLTYVHPHWDGNYNWSQSWVGKPIQDGYDPWYEVVGGDTVSVSCRPMFIISLTDGESNADEAVQTCDHLPHATSPYGSQYNNFNVFDGDSWQEWYDCADDYAYYAHIVDLRPDNDPVFGLPDDQTITFYSIYLFGTEQGGMQLMKDVAKNGGFVDKNNNRKPDLQSEWDSDSNGVPDNYYYANDGYALEKALNDIFININVLTRITSASSGAITGGGVRSAGLAYHGQFYPRWDIGNAFLTWVGKIGALWLDPFGYLREDNYRPGQRTLDLKHDYALKMFFSTSAQKTVAARFADTAGLGIEALFAAVDTVPVESLNFVWDGAKQLLNRSPDSRKIFYNRNGNRRPFTPNQNWLDSHLGFGDADSCDTLIQFIRGYDFSSWHWRSRTYKNNKVWKLGDVIHASPLPVGEPSEGYHLIYGDDSYLNFWNKYKDRRTMIYVGANDGMLHAFNGGYYTELEDPFKIGRIDSVPPALGKELWAFVPYNVLPHLKWLTDTSYCHVYFVDLKPYPTDMKIFTADPNHPDGWGTILVSGMGFGGPKISIGSKTYHSSYCCFDITNPEVDNRKPQFMWEFTDDSLGFTLCVPGVVKIKDFSSGRNDKWYLVFGSGPQTLYGECTQKARIYVVDPLNGSLVGKINLPDSNSAVTNIFTADFGLNYFTNLIYFGTYDNNNGGKVYRILTHNDPNPANWTLHEVINLNKPVTAEGTAATDNAGNLWIYFGTGKYFSNVDVANTDTMVFFGLKDDTTRTSPYTFNDLVDVTNVKIYADSVTGISGVNNFDDLVTLIQGADGWYRKFDSIPGERVVTPAIVIGGAVIFTTFIPSDTSGSAQGSDLCVGGGGGPQTGNLWALFYLTGTAYKQAMLDTNATGEFKTHVPILGDMPSEPAMHIGAKQEKVFVQSAGGLVGVDTPLPYNPRGGVILWRGR